MLSVVQCLHARDSSARYAEPPFVVKLGVAPFSIIATITVMFVLFCAAYVTREKVR